MSGRQIRWASVGRLAAIAAAAIAGIASLPALLGSDAPPPVPPDVGLAPSPGTTSPLPLEPRPALPPAAPAEPTRRRKHPPRQDPHRAREQAHPPREQPHPGGSNATVRPVPPSSRAPVPTYAYSPPPSSSDNLGIEP